MTTCKASRFVIVFMLSGMWGYGKDFHAFVDTGSPAFVTKCAYDEAGHWILPSSTSTTAKEFPASSYPAAIRELKAEGQIRPTCRHRCRQYGNNRIESDHRHVKRRVRAMQGPRTAATAWAVIQGIEAVQSIRKG